MKTHDLAEALEHLARMLRAGPNTLLSKIRFDGGRDAPSEHQIAVNLTTLAELSKVDKAQWIQLIRHYSLPIEVRPRDASRDILGKLLRFLEDHPDARRSLRNRVVHEQSTGASPELLRALSVLMRE